MFFIFVKGVAYTPFIYIIQLFFAKTKFFDGKKMYLCEKNYDRYGK